MEERLLELVDPSNWESRQAFELFIADVMSAKQEIVDQSQRDNAIFKDWRTWVTTTVPSYTKHPFAKRHEEFWEWVWNIRKDVRPRPFVGIWARGGAKSTSAELATILVGAKRARRYIWYVCETQEQADRHVETIADMLEDEKIQEHHPSLASREIGKFGNPKGWRRNRLRTGSGLTIDAIGLDTARRGARVKDARPDFMVFDDIDARHDSQAAIQKKIEVITTSLLPAGSNDLAVLMVQNLIHPDSVFSQLADGRAEFLIDRIVSGPFPAVEDLEVSQIDGRFVITGGMATWEGQDLVACQQMMDTFGYTSFMSEAQHDVEPPPGGIWDHIEFQRCHTDEVPKLSKIAVWVDPAVTEKDQSDSHAIQADGIHQAQAKEGGRVRKKIYRLFSWENKTSPEDSIRRAILKAIELGDRFDCKPQVGVETDQGGDTWKTVFNHVWLKLIENPSYPHITEKTRRPKFKEAKAGSGHGSKVHRNSLMLADYEQGNVIHVNGTHHVLERALKRFPKTKPFDLCDASYWSWRDLKGHSKGFF